MDLRIYRVFHWTVASRHRSRTVVRRKNPQRGWSILINIPCKTNEEPTGAGWWHYLDQMIMSEVRKLIRNFGWQLEL
jgi:hypothetical protein